MQRNTYINQESGYIALISAIVISILLIAITVTLSFTGFNSRFNVLDSEYKRVSQKLAEGCVESAILKIINNPSYSPGSGDEVILDAITNKKCKIISVIPGVASSKIIRTQASYRNAFTNFEATIDIDNNFVITTARECPTTCS